LPLKKIAPIYKKVTILKSTQEGIESASREASVFDIYNQRGICSF